MTKGWQFLLLETSLTAKAGLERQCPQLSEELFTVGNSLLSQLHPLTNHVRSSKEPKKKRHNLYALLYITFDNALGPQNDNNQKPKKQQSYLQGATPPKKAHVATDELTNPTEETNANTNAVPGEFTTHAHPTNPPTHLTDT